MPFSRNYRVITVYEQLVNLQDLLCIVRDHIYISFMYILILFVYSVGVAYSSLL